MNRDDWHVGWDAHLEKYLKAPPRTGIYIKNHFPSIRTSLEIACGSSRDSVFLSRKNVEATASDYAYKILINLKKRFRHPYLKYCPADAFDLPFRSNSFDMVFHNGFFILFNNNHDIKKMLIEQARVSRKYVLFLVHNRLNFELIKLFKGLAPNDPIYDIRFFEPTEIEGIVRDSEIQIQSLKILKFGGQFDLFFSKKIWWNFPNVLYPFRNRIIPILYRFQTWEKTERIACLVGLRK